DREAEDEHDRQRDQQHDALQPAPLPQMSGARHQPRCHAQQDDSGRLRALCRARTHGCQVYLSVSRTTSQAVTIPRITPVAARTVGDGATPDSHAYTKVAIAGNAATKRIIMRRATDHSDVTGAERAPPRIGGRASPAPMTALIPAIEA